jgi:O-antigen/teichoic acid export membrane protein
LRQKLKSLAGQTAIYGIPSIIGRLIGFLLFPVHIAVLNSTAKYGEVSVMYSIAAFIAVLLPHGMETGFFNFSRKSEDSKEVFNTGFSSIIIVSIFFLALCFSFSDQIINMIGYPGKGIYVKVFGLFLALDAVAALPYARLRFEQKAIRFATIRILSIVINFAATIYLLVLCPWLIKEGYSNIFISFYNEDHLVMYIFITNLIASTSAFLMLLPSMSFKFSFKDKTLQKKMLVYSYPLIFAGMAGIVNETIDRVLLKKLLPADIADSKAGIYSAFYKLSMFMTLFVQAFRYAAEPFFFQEAQEKDAKKTYAKVMEYFVYTCLAIFILIMVFLDFLAETFVRSEEFFLDPNGMKVVPILLLANLFLGVYYNLSVWYKLTHKTLYAAFISIGGALLTIAINVAFIPKYGFLASAWATLIVYFSMTVTSYFFSRKHYPIPYPLKRISIAFALVMVLYFIIS